MIQPVFDIGINFVFRSVYQIDRLADPVFLTDVFDQPERIRRLVKDIRSHVTFVPTGRIADQKIPLAGFGQKNGIQHLLGPDAENFPANIHAVVFANRNAVKSAIFLALSEAKLS